MADYTGKDGKSESASDEQEEITVECKQITCQPCLLNDRSNEPKVVGYCTNCEEHLCEDCFTNHRMPRPCRDHVLKRTTGNTLDQSLGTSILGRKHAATCPLHLNMTFMFFCKSHDQLCCETCKEIAHTACKDVNSIEEVSKGAGDSDEFNQYVSTLSDLIKRHDKTIDKARSNVSDAQRDYQVTRDNFIRVAEDIKSRNTNKMQTLATTCQAMAIQLRQQVTDINNLKDTKQFHQLFVEMKLAGKHVNLANVWKRLRELESDNTIETIGFVVKCIPETPAVYGQLVQQIRLKATLNVKLEDDKYGCCIQTMLTLPDNKLLVSDGANKSIKLICTKTDTIVSHISLDGEKAWAMTMTYDEEVYVTQPTSKKILHFPSRTSDVLSEMREIHVGYQCWGISFQNESFKVQCHSPAKTAEANLDGTITRTICRDVTKHEDLKVGKMVTKPMYSLYDEDDESMIISDHEQNSVTKVDSNGKVSLIVKDKMLQSPRGMVMDDRHSLIICSSKGNTLNRVTMDGEIHELFLQDLNFSPWSVALNSERELYVGGNCDKLHIYQYGQTGQVIRVNLSLV